MTKMQMTKDSREPLPDGWRWVRLGDVLSALESGSRPKGGAVGVESGVRSISAEHMTTHGTFDFSIKRFVPQEFYDEMTRGRIQPGDVLIVKDGATTGKTCFVDETFPFREAVVNEHVFICRASQDQVRSIFLFYWLWGPQGQYEIRSFFQGAAIGGISQGFVHHVSIPLPPLDEQRRIAGVLREQMAAVEKARAAAQARLEAVKTLPAAFLRQVFPHPGQALPNGWRWVRLGDKATLLPSRSIVSDGDAQVQAITTACLSESGFNPDGVKPARMRGRDVQECLVTTGEVLIARSNTPELVGRACMFDGIPEKAVATDLTIRVQANADLSPYFLSRYLSFLFVLGYWRDQAGGASGSMKKITRTQVMDIAVPVPCPAEQRRIARDLREQMAAVEKARAAAEEEQNTINALPAALLRRAFKGEV